MANFNSSEISSMISSKKYRIQRGNTLSGLADMFQGSFPSLKCMNKNSLMDKIYDKNRGSFLGSKDLMLEGKELDLTFVTECRSHLKIDKSKKEYIFTDEDQLVFSIKGQHSFFDDFIKVDRNIGESFKMNFKGMGRTSLPKSMPLPIGTGFSSSGSGRKIMEEIRRNVSGNLITTDQVSEAFLKMIGQLPSSSQIQNLAIRLEKENGICRLSSNNPCQVLVDQTERLSCKCLEDFYYYMPLSSKEKDELKNNIYTVNKIDEVKGSLDEIFKRIRNSVSYSLDYIKEFHKKIGSNIVIKENTKIFMPSKDIYTGIKAYSNEWKSVEDFWSDNKPISGSITTFKKYWLWSHEFVKSERISTSAKKTEICDIIYVMHYMGQGAYNKEYAIKIVEMTKAIMKGKDYFLCEKDESMKTLIEPSTLYLFKSIDSSAQKKFIEMMLEVKQEMGSSFQKFYITSGKRGSIEHTYSIVRTKIQIPNKIKGSLYNYYTGITGKYYNLIYYKYHGFNIVDSMWNISNITPTIRSSIESITPENLDKALQVAEKLMNSGIFQGTEHNSNSLDFRLKESAHKLEKKAATKGAYVYCDTTHCINKQKSSDHVHITLK